jgi:transcription elongation factor GreA
MKEDATPGTIVGLGDKVTLKLVPGNKSVVYVLVGKAETNPAEGLISVESPVGRAIHGKRIGEEVVVELPLKKVKYKIEKIN